MKTLYLMCGLPGSGKSSLIQHILDRNKQLNEQYVVISRDRIRKNLIGNGDYFSKETEVFQEFINLINFSLTNNNNYTHIFIDATHISQKSRAKVLSQLKISVKTNFKVLWVDTPLQTCLKNNEQRQGFEYVPKSVIRRLNIQFEAPIKEEFENYGFNNIEICKIQEGDEYESYLCLL